MNLPFFIAGRYLFARKSHNVINIVSAISAIGMAIGTAALIIILSVYNGFDDLIRKSMNNITPDWLITPAEGKVFIPEGDAFDWLSQQSIVTDMTSTLSDNVFLNYGDAQTIAMAKGVDDMSLMLGDIYLAAVGAKLAYKLGVNPAFVTALEMYFPDRKSKISLSNPAASLDMVKVHPTRTFNADNDDENGCVQVPIAAMRELMGYDKEVTSVELRIDPDVSAHEKKLFEKELRKEFGSSYTIKDRAQQNAALYKMMKYEKAAIFLILIFVIIIIAFNIFGSLSMLVIDKKQDIATFRSMGAGDKLVRNIFTLEGWLISLLGLAAGLVIGLIFAFLQQRFGFISLPGNYLIDSYPIIIKGGDIALTAAGVAAIGYIIALIPSRRI